MGRRANLRKKDHTPAPLLPTPPVKVGDPWLPAIRVGRTIPFGYEPDPEDDDILLPIVKELELLAEAKVLLKQYSSRNVADWLTKESGRYISHVGLLKRLRQEKSRAVKAGQHRRYARLYKKAIEAAEKLEGRLGGQAIQDLPVKTSITEKRRLQREADRAFGEALRKARRDKDP